ncbi:hypothetical protein GGI10_004254 [Coemansia sp. RSA 2530]|nr:hypothetical protein GGI10_004254 [Coemansia sp. RSA 2530]
MKQSALCLRWNAACLILLVGFLQTSLYRQIKSAILAIAVLLSAWSFLEWLTIALLAFNVSEAVWCLLWSQNQYTNIAMTPSQHWCIGFDTHVEPTTSNVPTRPPQMTLSTSTLKEQRNFLSVFDLESCRRVFSKGNFTTCPLRSPASRVATAGQFGYSMDGDLHMLLQVLKRVPGSARPVDNTPPSAFGNPCLASPYLPATHCGVSDMPSATLPMQQHLRTPPIIGIHQTARPEKRSSKGSNGSGRARVAGDMNYVAPFEVLEMYSIKRDILDQVDGMRKWFVRHLLRPLCKHIDELDSLIDQHGFSHLSCKQTVLDTTALERAKSARSGGIGIAGVSSHAQNESAIPQTLVDLSLKHGELPETKEHMALEKYLSIPGCLCRDYIIQCLHTLSQSDTLPDYIFDGGSNTSASAQEQPWNPAIHSTDGQLLLRLFCTFMDHTMPATQGPSLPFTDRYVLQPGHKPNPFLPVQIVQVARKHLHLGLVVKDLYYDISAGQTSLFIILTIFVLEVQRKCAGYLSLTNLGGKHVGLLAAVGE